MTVAGLFAADLAIAAAYFLIPLVVWRLDRSGVPVFRVPHATTLFGAFIPLCGLTHVMGAWNVWHGHCHPYGVPGIVTVGIAGLTAVVSLWTALRLPDAARRVAALAQAERADRAILESQIEALTRRIAEIHSTDEEAQALLVRLEKMRLEDERGRG